ncbi:hypothetical protein ACP275_07G028000 [Erythranthe tilingii]
MEAGLELDDDVFFKDLSKQISLLIMDDDEPADSLVHRPSLNLQGYNNQGINPARQASLFVNYDNHNHNHNQTSKRDQSKGTGVFIPRSSSNPRRKNVNKQGRFNKLPQISRADHNNNTQYMGYNNINNNNNSNNYNNINMSHDDNSFNLRRF